jgi:PleD family two-component response regulator
MNTQPVQVIQVVSNTADLPGRILLVEDDAAISQMLEEILAENGFTPCSATCAAEMDRILAQGGVDLEVEAKVILSHSVSSALNVPLDHQF